MSFFLSTIGKTEINRFDSGVFSCEKRMVWMAATPDAQKQDPKPNPEAQKAKEKEQDRINSLQKITNPEEVAQALEFVTNKMKSAPTAGKDMVKDTSNWIQRLSQEAASKLGLYQTDKNGNISPIHANTMNDTKALAEYSSSFGAAAAQIIKTQGLSFGGKPIEREPGKKVQDPDIIKGAYSTLAPTSDEFARFITKHSTNPHFQDRIFSSNPQKDWPELANEMFKLAMLENVKKANFNIQEQPNKTWLIISSHAATARANARLNSIGNIGDLLNSSLDAQGKLSALEKKIIDSQKTGEMEKDVGRSKAVIEFVNKLSNKNLSAKERGEEFKVMYEKWVDEIKNPPSLGELEGKVREVEKTKRIPLAEWIKNSLPDLQKNHPELKTDQLPQDLLLAWMLGDGKKMAELSANTTLEVQPTDTPALKAIKTEILALRTIKTVREDSKYTEYQEAFRVAALNHRDSTQQRVDAAALEKRIDQVKAVDRNMLMRGAVILSRWFVNSPQENENKAKLSQAEWNNTYSHILTAAMSAKVLELSNAKVNKTAEEKQSDEEKLKEMKKKPDGIPDSLWNAAINLGAKEGEVLFAEQNAASFATERAALKSEVNQSALKRKSTKLNADENTLNLALAQNGTDQKKVKEWLGKKAFVESIDTHLAYDRTKNGHDLDMNRWSKIAEPFWKNTAEAQIAQNGILSGYKAPETQPQNKDTWDKVKDTLMGSAETGGGLVKAITKGLGQFLDWGTNWDNMDEKDWLMKGGLAAGLVWLLTKSPAARYIGIGGMLLYAGSSSGAFDTAWREGEVAVGRKLPPEAKRRLVDIQGRKALTYYQLFGTVSCGEMAHYVRGVRGYSQKGIDALRNNDSPEVFNLILAQEDKKAVTPEQRQAFEAARKALNPREFNQYLFNAIRQIGGEGDIDLGMSRMLSNEAKNKNFLDVHALTSLTDETKLREHQNSARSIDDEKQAFEALYTEIRDPNKRVKQKLSKVEVLNTINTKYAPMIVNAINGLSQESQQIINEIGGVGAVKNLLYAESSTDASAVSSTGALGLMQILPSTAIEMPSFSGKYGEWKGKKEISSYNFKKDTYQSLSPELQTLRIEMMKPEVNIRLGIEVLISKYKRLRELTPTFNNLSPEEKRVAVIAAYNRGEGVIKNYITILDEKGAQEFIYSIPATAANPNFAGYMAAQSTITN